MSDVHVGVAPAASFTREWWSFAYQRPVMSKTPLYGKFACATALTAV
jgi:hypothetical protein